jgi:hypothetical protein
MMISPDLASIIALKSWPTLCQGFMRVKSRRVKSQKNWWTSHHSYPPFIVTKFHGYHHPHHENFSSKSSPWRQESLQQMSLRFWAWPVRVLTVGRVGTTFLTVKILKLNRFTGILMGYHWHSLVINGIFIINEVVTLSNHQASSIWLQNYSPK